VSPLKFERTGMFWLDSSEGYRVMVSRVHGTEAWVYVAYAPARQVEKDSGRTVVAFIDPLKGRMPLKVRYEQGEEVPTGRELLGCFPSLQHGGTEQAKAAAIASCNTHHQAVLQAKGSDDAPGFTGPSAALLPAGRQTRGI
jgi:hypothetical protein